MEGNGKEIKDDAALDTPGMIFLVNSSTISCAELELLIG
jgi:hypothetical protein